MNPRPEHSIRSIDSSGDTPRWRRGVEWVWMSRPPLALIAAVALALAGTTSPVVRHLGGSETIARETTVETVTVDSASPTGASTLTPLIAGETYRFEVSGTYVYDAATGGTGDAECGSPTGNPPFTDGAGLGPDVLDLLINNAAVTWTPVNGGGTCASDHVYDLTFVADQTAMVSFRVNDPNPAGNSGALTVDVIHISEADPVGDAEEYLEENGPDLDPIEEQVGEIRERIEEEAPDLETIDEEVQEDIDEQREELEENGPDPAAIQEDVEEQREELEENGPDPAAIQEDVEERREELEENGPDPEDLADDPGPVADALVGAVTEFAEDPEGNAPDPGDGDVVPEDTLPEDPGAGIVPEDTVPEDTVPGDLDEGIGGSALPDVEPEPEPEPEPDPGDDGGQDPEPESGDGDGDGGGADEEENGSRSAERRTSSPSLKPALPAGGTGTTATPGSGGTTGGDATTEAAAAGSSPAGDGGAQPALSNPARELALQFPSDADTGEADESGDASGSLRELEGASSDATVPLVIGGIVLALTGVMGGRALRSERRRRRQRAYTYR